METADTLNVELDDQFERYRETWLKEIGDELELRRKAQNLNQENLETASGVSRATISAIENATANFYIDNLLALLYVLKVPWTEFNKSPVPQEFLGEHEVLHRRFQRVLALNSLRATDFVMDAIESALIRYSNISDKER